MFFSRPTCYFAFYLGLSVISAHAQWDETAGDSVKTSVDTSTAKALEETKAMPTAGVAENSSKSKLSSGQKDMYNSMAASGNVMYQFGSVLAWGGLASSILGGAVNVPALNTVGSLSYLVGLPFMGIGAGKVENASLKLNPEGEKERTTGWPMYWTGWGLQGLGIVLIVASLDTKTDEFTGDKELEINAGTFASGIVSIIGGSVCHFISWYQFSKRREQGNINLAGLAFQPQLHFDKERLDGGGLALNYAF